MALVSSFLFRCHHGVELLVVDLPVPVNVRLLDHGVDLLRRQLLPEVHHDDGQLLPVDVAVAILVFSLEKEKNLR